MANFWQCIKRLFKGKNSIAPQHNREQIKSPKKKFIINENIIQRQSLNTPHSEPSGKLFEIISERNINISRLNGRKGFAFAYTTRPRQCPYCRDIGKVVKTENNKWLCSPERDGCGYIWK